MRYTPVPVGPPEAAGFAIDASGLLAVARYQDETTRMLGNELYDTMPRKRLFDGPRLTKPASIEDVLVTVNSDSVYLYRADQTLLWRFDTGSGVLGATPSLTEAPRFLRVFPSGLYVESASENGFYNITQGVLSRAAQLPLAYTHEMSQPADVAPSCRYRRATARTLSPRQHRLSRPNSTMVTASRCSLEHRWTRLAEQPERLRRITTPVCFSN